MWCVVLEKKVGNRQSSPDIKRDPAVVSILIYRGRRDSLECFKKILMLTTHPAAFKSETLGRI